MQPIDPRQIKSYAYPSVLELLKNIRSVRYLIEDTEPELEDIVFCESLKTELLGEVTKLLDVIDEQSHSRMKEVDVPLPGVEEEWTELDDVDDFIFDRLNEPEKPRRDS